MIHTGRHFLQILEPDHVPRILGVLRAMDQPVIDHRGAEFAVLLDVLERLRWVFQTTGPVVGISLGTGACEAAMVNTLSAGDRVVIFETGDFSHVWRQVADRLRLDVDGCAEQLGVGVRRPRNSRFGWPPTVSMRLRLSSWFTMTSNGVMRPNSGAASRDERGRTSGAADCRCDFFTWVD